MRYVIVLLLAGCATQQPQYKWVGPGGNEELQRAMGECEAMTLASPHYERSRAAGIMLGCMRGKGWQLVGSH
jgi:hypothetical protein